MPKKGIFELLISEVLSPIYVFQIASIGLWFWEGYYKYAVCVIVISLLGISQALYTTTTNLESIRHMARFECPITVKRISKTTEKPEFLEIQSGDLVPGDVVVVPDQCVLPCDLLLISG